MIATNASELPVITEIDFDRLTQLTESPRYRSSDAQRVLGLKVELDRRLVVAANRVPKGAVTMNSRVRVRDLASNETTTYTLVYPNEADIESNRLSVLAPLGTALLGRFAGDEFEIRIDDYGKFVDPGKIRGRDLKDVKPGGLGVHLMRKVMDRLEYRRNAHGGTSLVMAKRLPSPAGSGGRN